MIDVGPAAEEAGGDAQQDRADHRDDRGQQTDLEGVAAAVEQADGDVAAVRIGAQQELRVPGRPDRDAGQADDVRRACR